MSEDERLKLAGDLLDSREDGRLKLYVTMMALTYRRNHPSLFQEGDYVPLDVYGSKRDHVCAFSRSHGDQALVVVTPRLAVGLSSDKIGPPIGSTVWGDTRIAVPSTGPGSPYRSLFTGETLMSSSSEEKQILALGQVCAHFPVAILERTV